MTSNPNDLTVPAAEPAGGRPPADRGDSGGERRRLGESLNAVVSGALRTIEADTAAASERRRLVARAAANALVVANRAAYHRAGLIRLSRRRPRNPAGDDGERFVVLPDGTLARGCGLPEAGASEWGSASSRAGSRPWRTRSRTQRRQHAEEQQRHSDRSRPRSARCGWLSGRSIVRGPERIETLASRFAAPRKCTLICRPASVATGCHAGEPAGYRGRGAVPTEFVGRNCREIDGRGCCRRLADPPWSVSICGERPAAK